MIELYYTILQFFWSIFDTMRRALWGTRTYRIIVVFWELLSHLWYYALIGAFAAVVVARLLPKERVRAFLSANRGLAILFASLVGLISPMSTFSAIPIVGGLMVAGFPVPPLIAFLVSSPLMNPSLFIITWGVIGPEMALARTLSALVLGLISGGIADVLSRRRMVDFSRSVHPEFASRRNHPLLNTEKADTWRGEVRVFFRQFKGMLGFIARYFLLALLIASAVQALISPRWIANLFGGRDFGSALMGGLLGIPLYVCGGGTVATIAVLVGMGMGQGAALAFFLTGPATKISTMLTLQAVMRRKITVLYLGVTLLGGVLLGYGYSVIAPELELDEMYYGQVETKEDAILFKRGVGSPKIW